MAMSSAQVAEAELQQSVMMSDEEADYEMGEQGEDGSTTDTVPHPQAVNGGREPSRSESSLDELEDTDIEDQDASGEDAEEDMDAEGEDDIGPTQDEALASDVDDADDAESDGGDFEDGEDAVGAVKIKEDPSEASDNDSDISSHLSAAEEDSDEEVAWEEAGDGEDEENESETAQTNTCLFCKQDEENDPSEEFETYLMCRSCKTNAHQQCAREAGALRADNNDKTWKCPDCDVLVPKIEDQDESDVSMGEDAEAASSAAKESQPLDATEGTETRNASIESQEDSSVNRSATSSSRPQRKRKSPSAEPEDSATSLRKRRRNVSSATGSITDADADLSTDAGRSQSRPLRLKVARPARAIVEKRSRTSLLIKLLVPPTKLKEELSRKRTHQRRRATGSARTPRATAPRAEATPTPGIPAVLETPFTADSYSQPFYSFFDKETDDAKGKPYGGILSELEADTSKTLPQPEDRRRFDQAKQTAEDEWRARVLAMQAEAEVPTRKPKKASDHASQIECIEFGGWEIDTWYAAPYPAEYSRNRVLYICEFCLKYMNSDYVAWRHKLKCGTKHPPGDEIYRHRSVSFFEVDGRKNPVYCQNLCLLAKLFLGSKTLYYDVEPFLFYVLCEYDENGYHFVGYFSKEKRASSQNNVSCILTLPIHQRKGYGNLLIDFSYLLTKVEEKTGSPEKPLSDMGLVSYRNYWRLILCRYFISMLENESYRSQGLSVKRISDDTGMTADDIISALEGLRALVRDPQTRLYAFRVDIEYCQQYVAKWESKGYVQLKPEALAWTPYVMGRSNAVNFELGPPINTIAPREDDEAKLEEGSNSLVVSSKPVVNGLKTAATQLGESLDKSRTDETEGDGVAVEKTAADDKENATPREQAILDAEEAIEDPENSDAPEEPEAWDLPYRSIPPSRFEVFPTVTHGRRNDRPRVSRPAAPRTSSSASRPKRPAGPRRSTLSRQKSSSSSRRKSGGTGRGPGRWPKGTKKADYGNADSGPGLPPGWTPSKAELEAAAAAEGKKENGEDDESAQDEVRVFVAPLGANGVSNSPPRVVSDVPADAEAVDDIDAEGETE